MNLPPTSTTNMFPSVITVLEQPQIKDSQPLLSSFSHPSPEFFTFLNWDSVPIKHQLPIPPIYLLNPVTSDIYHCTFWLYELDYSRYFIGADKYCMIPSVLYWSQSVTLFLDYEPQSNEQCVPVWATSRQNFTKRTSYPNDHIVKTSLSLNNVDKIVQSASRRLLM